MYTRVHALKAPIWQRISAKMLFFFLAAAFLFLVSLYIYLVHKTVMNVVAEGNDQSAISSLSSTTGTMEFQYITLKNTITLDLAYQKGFQDTSPTKFISGDQTLTYN